MKKMYGLQNDKENINLTVGDDKAWITIQTAEGFEARELNLQYDNEGLGVISADKVKLMGFSCNYDGGNESEVYEENGMIGIKTEYTNSNIVQSIAEMSKKLTDLDDKINLKVDTKEFWDFVKHYKDESQMKKQPEPVQRALKRIKEIDRVTDVRIDEEFKATDLNMTENRLTITIDYLENNH